MLIMKHGPWLSWKQGHVLSLSAELIFVEQCSSSWSINPRQKAKNICEYSKIYICEGFLRPLDDACLLSGLNAGFKDQPILLQPAGSKDGPGTHLVELWLIVKLNECSSKLSLPVPR